MKLARTPRDMRYIKNKVDTDIYIRWGIDFSVGTMQRTRYYGERNNSRRFLNSADSGSESPPSNSIGAISDSEAGGDEGAEKDSGAMVAGES